MKVARLTAIVFAFLLLGSIGRAQFAPGYYSGYYGMPQVFSPYQGYQPYSAQVLPWNNFATPSYNFLTNDYYPTPLYFSNSYSSPYTSWYNSSSSYEDEEERLEKEQDRQDREEEREEEREQREEERREAREERRNAERKHSKSEVNNWPPIPKSSEQAKKLQPPVILPSGASKSVGAAVGNAESTRAQVPPVINSHPAKEVSAPVQQVVAPIQQQSVPTVQHAVQLKQKNWWENDPEYQKFLRDKKAYEKAQQAQPDWPPKPQPVVNLPAPQKQIDSTTGKLAASSITECTSCGPKEGPLSQQVEQMKELADPREVFILTRPPTNRVSEGVKRVMNTIYQSCEAYDTLLRPDYCQDGFIGKNYCAKKAERKDGDLTAYHNPEEFFSYETASQPGSNVMIPNKPENSSCRDMNKTPPVFKVGGRPSIQKLASGKVQLDLFNDSKSKKFVTLDCSGFVTAAYSAAGLNFSPNSPTTAVDTNTLRSGANKCLGTVEFSSNQSIVSGDIAVFAGESQHSMIFDRVGSDPFGLNEIAPLPQGENAATYCRSQLSPSKFDFVIAQSGLYGGRVAVSESRAVDYIVNFGNGMMDGINAQIMQLAEDACVAKVTGSKTTANHSSGAKLLRHKGNSIPGCVREAPTEIVGQSCVKACS